MQTAVFRIGEMPQRENCVRYMPPGFLSGCQPLPRTFPDHIHRIDLGFPHRSGYRPHRLHRLKEFPERQSRRFRIPLQGCRSFQRWQLFLLIAVVLLCKVENTARCGILLQMAPGGSLLIAGQGRHHLAEGGAAGRF